MPLEILTYREARREDLEALVALLANDPLGSQREIEKDNHNQLLVAESKEQLVGMLQLTFIPYLTHIGSWRCLIEGVRIHADYRGSGYGKGLLSAAAHQR